MYLSTGDITAVTIALCTASFVIILGLIRIYVLEKRLHAAKHIMQGLIGNLMHIKEQEEVDTHEFNEQWEHYFNSTGRWTDDDKS